MYLHPIGLGGAYFSSWGWWKSINYQLISPSSRTFSSDDFPVFHGYKVAKYTPKNPNKSQNRHLSILGAHQKQRSKQANPKNECFFFLMILDEIWGFQISNKKKTHSSNFTYRDTSLHVFLNTSKVVHQKTHGSVVSEFRVTPVVRRRPLVFPWARL